MKNKLGVMQGRLSPPSENKIQSFPLHTWQEEFKRAKDCKLDLIEWVFDAATEKENPLMDSKIKEIHDVSAQSGVGVLSVCADYFMGRPLIRVSPGEQAERLNVLEHLLEQCSHLGVKYVVLPFVDASDITSDSELKEVTRLMREYAPLAQNYGITLCLEASLNPGNFKELIQEINHPSVKINYDIGNSASLGYNPLEEIEAYGSSVATIHIKDRKRGGSTVPLGTGDADFPLIFSTLEEIGYSGPFILQAARMMTGHEVETIRTYINFVSEHLRRYPALSR